MSVGQELSPIEIKQETEIFKNEIQPTLKKVVQYTMEGFNESFILERLVKREIRRGSVALLLPSIIATTVMALDDKINESLIYKNIDLANSVWLENRRLLGIEDNKTTRLFNVANIEDIPSFNYNVLSSLIRDIVLESIGIELRKVVDQETEVMIIDVNEPFYIKILWATNEYVDELKTNPELQKNDNDKMWIYCPMTAL